MSLLDWNKQLIDWLNSNFLSIPWAMHFAYFKMHVGLEMGLQWRVLLLSCNLQGQVAYVVLTPDNNGARFTGSVKYASVLTIHLEHMGLTQIFVAVCVAAVVAHVDGRHLGNVEGAVIAKVLIEEERRERGREGGVWWEQHCGESQGAEPRVHHRPDK